MELNWSILLAWSWASFCLGYLVCLIRNEED